MIHTYTEQQIASAITWRDVLHDLPAAFEALRTGDASIAPRQRVDCGVAKLSSMGAVWQSRQVATYKTYTSVAGQFNFLLNLFDLATGAHHVMPGNEITRARTAAMTAWAAREMANPNPQKLALFGLGLQGRTHLEALQETLQFKEIAVVDTADVSAQCALLASQLGIPVYQALPKEAVTVADVVVTITRSKTPVFDGAWLKPGASVCAVGTSLPSGSEIDAITRQRSSQVIVEWKPQSLVEAGEIVQGLQDKSLSLDRIKDLPEMLASQAPWRQNPNDIMLFKAVGVGLSDLVAARLTVAASLSC
ncbi:MAG: ornithine cyclodeaminase family protein [Polaromonas sp.]